jgi:folate-binding protein YgfZ
MNDSAFYTLLDHEGLLAVRGPDAAKFLQGQLTCNLNYLDAQTSSLGARCTVKGRMFSSFRILPHGDGYLLSMASELLEAQLTELKKFAVFSKSSLTDVSGDWVRFGLHGGQALLAELGLQLDDRPDALVSQGDLLAVRASAGRAELWAPATQAGALRARLARQMAEAPLQAWLLGQIRAGIGQVFGASRELFIPQMLNLQSLGGVSFKKGCYTGQEIVARMQYLGKLKRRMYRLSLDLVEPPAAATPVFSPVHSSAVGEVVLAACGDGHVELLAVLQEDAVSDARLHLGQPDGPALSLLDLPYSIDNDRDIQR